MEKFEVLASKYVKNSYVKLGIDNLRNRKNQMYVLLEQKKLPSIGFDDSVISYILENLSSMDSNNFAANAGVGEREGRIFSRLVASRNYRLAHGIGRSGNITEVQPKAAGSSLLYSLTNSLAHHALKIAHIHNMAKSLVVPVATGMSLTLCFLTLMKLKPESKYIIWSRIDQKSCFKSILTANCIPLIVENILDSNGLMTTNIPEIERLMIEYGDKVLCVLSTTSCFAPRQPDSVAAIAQLCKLYNIGHVVNNAYGLQCKYICKQINRACLLGRVDAGKTS
jgi:O-phospho-L-seryl-tRNASec:L-selenocysteinyl-tRNA synthase